jgi:hypothetical protein
MRRTPRGFEPVAEFDVEAMERYAIGSTVEVSVRQRRSSPHHRLYWSVLSKVVENCEDWSSAEQLHDAIKLQLGYTERMKTIDGRIAWCASSTAFGRMDQGEFRVFFDHAMGAISEFVLPGVDPVALVREAERNVA